MASLFTAIIYLDRNGMLIYSSSLHRALQFNFALNVIRDLEVINSELLTSQLASFFIQTGLKPFQAVILLADGLLFEKVFSPEQINNKEELNLFLDSLPFERVGFITYTGEQSTYVATNSELYHALITCFEAQHCVISAVLPTFTVEMDANKVLSLNDQQNSEIYSRSVSLNQYNYLRDAVVPSSKSIRPEKKTETLTTASSDIQRVQTESPDRKRLFVMLGVFVILIVLLGIVAITML